MSEIQAKINKLIDNRETVDRIADMPDHMIHLNGDKFLGPR